MSSLRRERRLVVTLRRANGRAVKWVVRSRYAAKALVREWNARYDDTYYVETRPYESDRRRVG